MSVLIRGLEIPKNCSECPVALSGKYCRINKTHTTYIKLPMRPNHCPLVELPEHHGRLIDADKLKTFFPRCDNNMDIKIGSARATINHMPTIIEAEGAEE